MSTSQRPRRNNLRLPFAYLRNGYLRVVAELDLFGEAQQLKHSRRYREATKRGARPREQRVSLELGHARMFGRGGDHHFGGVECAMTSEC